MTLVYPTTRQQVGAYLTSLTSFGRLRLAILSLLILCGSFIEGIGIVLIVPVLGLVLGGDAIGGGRLFARMRDLLGGLTVGEQLVAVLGGFVVLLVVRAIVLWQRDIQLARLSLQVVDQWRARLIDAVAHAPWRRFQELHPAKIEFAVVSEVGRLALGSDRLLRGMVAAFQLLVQLALAFYLSPALSLLIVAASLLMLPLVLPAARAARRYGESVTRDGRYRYTDFSDFLAGMKLAKAHDAEARYVDAQQALTIEMQGRSLRFTSTQVIGGHIFQVAGGVAAAIVIVAALTVVKTPVAILSGMLVLLGRIVSPAQQLLAGGQGILTMLPAVKHLLLLDRDLREGAKVPVVAVPSPTAPDTPAAIELRGIGYSPGRDRFALNQIDAVIRPGELTVLFGPSGAGKTTLADILLGLLTPDRGSIAIDGRPLDDAGRPAWRRSVGYVPQDGFLFDQTIRQNLSWACPDASEAQLWQALEMAEADRFVAALPDGLDTPTGPRGARLSGGERQRICLARALIRRPRLLLLDEATNALDTAVEQRLLQTLARLRGSTSILLIAHRVPDGLPIDRLWRLDDGTIRQSRADGGAID